MSSDELRNRIAEVLMQQWPNTIFRRDAAQVTADAILALPEMQAMLAEDAEVERLRAALALAVGEVSTYGPYLYTSPEQLMEYFMQEARGEQ